MQLPVVEGLSEEYMGRVVFELLDVVDYPVLEVDFDVSDVPTMFIVTDKINGSYICQKLVGFTGNDTLRMVLDDILSDDESSEEDDMDQNVPENTSDVEESDEEVNVTEVVEEQPLFDIVSNVRGSLNVQAALVDGGDVELTLLDSPVEKIVFRGLNMSRGLSLGLEEVPVNSISGRDFVKSFAIDPSLIEFEEAIVTVVATGNELYKCADWNFSSQSCLGEWTLFKTDLVPGEEYKFILTRGDPGFGEILITNAMHLDFNRGFISDVYDDVKDLDDVWCEEIFNGEYVRVTFERNLTNVNDISIYPRVITGDPVVEVYKKGEVSVITSFSSIVDDEYNRVLLSGLVGEQDTFDLRVVGGSLIFDHIIDPIQQISSVVLNSSLGTNSTYENLTAYVSPLNGSQKYIYNWKLDGSSFAVLNMPFEGGSNSTFTKDYSDYSNNGTVTGATYNATGGYDGKGAYEFNGTASSYIDLGDKPEFTIGNEFTVSIWVNPSNFIDYTHIVTKGTTGNFEWQMTSDYSNRSYFGIWNTAEVSYLDVAGTALPLDTWTHITVTYSSLEGLALYENGALKNTTLISAATGTKKGDSASSLLLGKRGDNGYGEWNGSMDEFMLFNRTFSAEQVSALYNNRTDLIVSQETTFNNVWQVCVTPNNNTADGTEVCSGNLTVLQALNNIILNSSSGYNLISDDLTAYPNSDADGKIIYDWRVNGSSIAVLNMPFDGRTAAGAMPRDYARGNNVSTVSGAVYNSTGGYDGKGAYEFGPIVDYLLVLDSADFNLGSEYTVEAWIKPDTNGVGDRCILGTYEPQGFMMCISDEMSTQDELMFFSPSIGWVESDYVVPINVWSHVVYTKDAANIGRFYVNGTLVKNTTTNVGNITVGGDLYIGLGGLAWVTQNFRGTIDEIKMYDRTLSPEQVANNYNSGTDIIVSQETAFGDIWSVCGTPNDDVTDGTDVCSNDLAISTPSIDAVIINSTLGTNFTTENLTAYLINLTSTAKVIYDWKKDGSSIALLNAPFETDAICGAGSNLTCDYSDYGNNGTVSGAVYNSSGGYDGRGAFEFDGVSDYISLGDKPEFTIQDEFSYSLWVKPDTSILAYIIAKGDSGNYEWGMYRKASTNEVDFIIWNTSVGNYMALTGNTAVPTG
jgi:hypothetical protein